MAVAEVYCAELDKILKAKALQPIFQPIVNLQNGSVSGYEALIRGPSDSPLHSPLQLFKTAVACNRLEQLEMLCRQLSIESFAAAKTDTKLFLNVNPLLLLTADHPSGLTKQMLSQAQVDPSKVVIEISEQYQVEDAELLVKAVQHYRQLGFLIAIDDLGSGFSGLKLWSELQPDIVKIDRYFVSEIDKDLTKRAFVRNIVSLAKAIGATIVVEGIETEDELRLCRELGADLAQGYLLGRPQAALKPAVNNVALLANLLPPEGMVNNIEPLLVNVLPVAHSQSAAEVAARFQQEPELQSVAVIQQGRPVGLICRSDLLTLFAQPFGRALYEKKPIGKMMNAKPVIVDIQCSMDEVSQIVADDEQRAASWYFIICRNGQYLGLGSVRQLLKKISERKIQHARYANPLTLLPGNVPIYQRIDLLLQQQAEFAVAYLDLNHFKPYNDLYGYSKGDTVLLMLAEVIQHYTTNKHFIGHIGGDDFVLVASPDECEELCQQILQRFAIQIVNHYRQEDLQQGGISTLNRSGEQCFYPILSLAIGITYPDSQLCRSHHDVAALTAAAKFEAKRMGGNAIFCSRRCGPALRVNTTLARPSLA